MYTFRFIYVNMYLDKRRQIANCNNTFSLSKIIRTYMIYLPLSNNKIYQNIYQLDTDCYY